MIQIPAPGQSQLILENGKEVALFNVEGRLYAIGNRCPHRSGPLAKGKVEKVPPSPLEGEGRGEGAPDTLAVRCPIHGWLFELATGRCLTRSSASVPTYPVLCEGDPVCLGPDQGVWAGPSAP